MHKMKREALVVTADAVPDPKGDVCLSTDLNIKFSAASTCVQSIVSKLDNFDESLGKWFVTTGGVEGNSGHETVSNWFKIEKFDGDYKLLFACDICRVVCGDIGICIDQAGTRRLAFSDTPFKVMFREA
ncbi:hypothetical protein QYF36_018084 [Acer negundo]|nr:hypothetical protein QYF36_018084 [Acer negundo]